MGIGGHRMIITLFTFLFKIGFLILFGLPIVFVALLGGCVIFALGFSIIVALFMTIAEILRG